MLLYWDSGCSNLRLDSVTKQTFYIEILLYKTYQIDSLSHLIVSTIILDANKNIVKFLGWVIFKAFFTAINSHSKTWVHNKYSSLCTTYLDKEWFSVQDYLSFTRNFIMPLCFFSNNSIWGCRNKVWSEKMS